jgi:hypothetical protein
LKDENRGFASKRLTEVKRLNRGSSSRPWRGPESFRPCHIEGREPRVRVETLDESQTHQFGGVSCDPGREPESFRPCHLEGREPKVRDEAPEGGASRAGRGQEPLFSPPFSWEIVLTGRERIAIISPPSVSNPVENSSVGGLGGARCC